MKGFPKNKMTYLVIHHSAGKQFVSTPEQIGGNYEFYNKIITPTQIFDRHEDLHPRGSFQSYDICFTGDFRKDTLTDFQKEALQGLIKEFRLPVIRHRDLKDFGATIGILETECPAKLPTYTFKIASNKDIPELIEAVKEYGLELEVGRFNLNVLGKPSGDTALQLARDNGVKGSFILFCSGNNDTWSDAVTHYDPVSNSPFIIAENSVPTNLLTFEIAHAIQKWYNGHKGTLPSVEIKDIYTPSENLIKEKYQSVMPYLPLLEESALKLMTEHEVASLQALEGYSDPEGVVYWTGKPLSEYLKARLSDKVKQITDLNGII